MARNKMSDLNDHLFAQLERLGDEELKGEEMENEIKRARAISEISKQVVEGAKTTILAIKTLPYVDPDNGGKLKRLTE